MADRREREKCKAILFEMSTQTPLKKLMSHKWFLRVCVYVCWEKVVKLLITHALDNRDTKHSKNLSKHNLVWVIMTSICSTFRGSLGLT